MALSSNQRLLSEPCDVLWAGFRSNTYALQQAGWELAVEQEFVSSRIRLLLRNKDMQLYGISDNTYFDFYRSAHEYVQRPVFRIMQVVPMLQVVRLNEAAVNFKLFDAAPQFTSVEYDSIDDLGIFVSPMVRTEELIVEPADVATLLEQIRRMQAPGQAEIRAKRRTDETVEARPRQQFHAQIITLDQSRHAA